MFILFAPTVLAQTGHYVWDATCFTDFLTGTGTIATAFPAGGASAADIGTFTFSQTFAATPQCTIGLTAIEMTTNSLGFDFQVLPKPCTSTSLTVQGKRGTQTTMSVIKLSYIANSFASVQVGSQSFTDSNVWTPLGINIPTSLLGTNGAVGNYFVIGYSGYRCNWWGCSQLGFDYSALNFNTAGSARTSLSGRSTSFINRIDVGFILFEANTLSNTSNQYRIATFSICGGGTTINTGGVQNCNPSGFPGAYLSENVAWGIVSWVERVSSAPKFSIQASYQSAPYNYQYAQISASTSFSNVRFGYFILYEKACPAATFPAALYLSSDRSTCSAACQTSQFYDTCKRCFLCHITCLTCADDQNTDCLSCDSTKHRIAGGAFSPTSTCDCDSTSAEFSPVQAACNPCDTTCLTCSAGANPNACLTCDTSLRFLTGTTCVCNPGTLNVAGVCVTCGTNCATCAVVIANCVTCTAGNWLAANYPKACAATCPSGQYQSTTPQLCAYCVSPCATCITSSTSCLSCVPNRYLYTTSCLAVCPVGFYANPPTLTCLPCDPNCPSCTSLTVCTACVNPLYLHQGVCYSSCPDGFFGRQRPTSTWVCLSCLGNCVDVVLFQIGLHDINYYPATYLIVNISFSYPITGFDKFYSLGVPFPYSLQQLPTSPDGLNYSFLIKPKNQIAFGVVTLNSVSYTPAVMGILNTPMSSDVWKLSKSYNFSFLLGSLGQASRLLGYTANALQNLTIPPQLRVLLSMGLPSLQFTSSLLLSDYPLPKHLYDGLRILSVGNYFTIPSWEFSPNNRSALSFNVTGPANLSGPRRFLGTQSVTGRLQRVSFSEFLVLNVYVQAAVLLATLLCNVLLQFMYRERKVSPTLAAAGWVVLDFVHQYVIMYLYLSTVVFVLSFSLQSVLGIASLIICILLNLEFLAYQLYRFHDFNSLRHFNFGEPGFQQYLVKFGHMVRYLKFSEEQSCWCSPWVNPQFYHFYSPIKKTMMMVAVALFADRFEVQLTALLLVQFLEIVRLAVLRPYYSTCRNVTRFIVEVLAGAMLGLTFYMGMLFKEVQTGSQPALFVYDALGWVVLALSLCFNVYYLAMTILGVVDRVRQGDRQMSIDLRKQFFYNRVLQITKDTQKIDAKDMYQLVRKGNLNERDKTLPDIDVRFESVKLIRSTNKSIFIQVSRCLELKMCREGESFDQTNNTTQSIKIMRTGFLSQVPNKKLKKVCLQLLADNQEAEIKTFARVRQREFKFGDIIPLAAHFQEVRTVDQLKCEHILTLSASELIQMFPLPESVLNQLNDRNLS